MLSRFDELKAYVLERDTSRELICMLHGYTMNACIKKMKKSDIARLLQDVQFMLRVAYEYKKGV